MFKIVALVCHVVSGQCNVPEYNVKFDSMDACQNQLPQAVSEFLQVNGPPPDGISLEFKCIPVEVDA